jgi:hypothetical protein
LIILAEEVKGYLKGTSGATSAEKSLLNFLFTNG